MRYIISLFFLLLSLASSAQDIAIPKQTLASMLKELEEYDIQKIELNKKDSIITIYAQRIEGKEEVIKELKLNAEDYEKSITSFGEKEVLYKEQISTFEKKIKKLGNTILELAIGIGVLLLALILK